MCDNTVSAAKDGVDQRARGARVEDYRARIVISLYEVVMLNK